MDKLKKFGKEWSLFLLVIGITLVLAGYHQLRPTTYKVLTQDKVVSKLDSKDDFILIVGQTTKSESSDDSSDETSTQDSYYSATVEQMTNVKNFIKDKHQKVYFMAADDVEDIDAFLKDNLGSTSSELPQTFMIINGEVYRSKTGTVKYYDFSKLVTDWKDKK